MDALANSSVSFLLKAFIEDHFPVACLPSGELLLANHFSDKWEYNYRQISTYTICLNIITFYLFCHITRART